MQQVTTFKRRINAQKCRETSLVRCVYKDLSSQQSHQFDFSQNFFGENNQFVANEILKEASARSSEVKEDEVKAACEIYFHSLYQDNIRSLNGSKQKHRKQQRKIQRKKQKLRNRQKQFASGNIPSTWTMRRKARVQFMLSHGTTYISSDESEDNDSCLYTRPLPWLKRKYAKCMQELDTLWHGSLSQKSKQMTRQRMRSGPSDNERPNGIPDYLAKPQAPTDDHE